MGKVAHLIDMVETPTVSALGRTEAAAGWTLSRDTYVFTNNISKPELARRVRDEDGMCPFNGLFSFIDRHPFEWNELWFQDLIRGSRSHLLYVRWTFALLLHLVALVCIVVQA